MLKILSTRKIAIIIGNRLKYLREQRHISQQEVANFVGCARSALSHWERGVSTPNLSYLILLAQFYDVDINYFIKATMEQMEDDA